MKKLLCTVLSILMIFSYSGGAVWAINEMPARAKLQPSKNAKPVEFAFVFDGPSDKNAEVLQLFQKQITRSLLPDYKPVFSKDLTFTGNWTEAGAKNVSEKALASRARFVVSLGYMSSVYYANRKNKNKIVMTIDQYGLRDFGKDIFNPIAQNVSDMVVFKKLVPNMTKTAILINENYYKVNSANWNTAFSNKLKEKKCDVNFVVVPVGHNVSASLSKMPSDVDAVFVTPLYNLTKEQRKELYNNINNRKLPSFSSVGQEDVELGAMLGTSAADADRKLAEATSFNIYGVLKGNVVQNEKIPYFDDNVIFYNSDSGEIIGYDPPLRLLNNSTVISHKELPKYDLGTLLNQLDESNLDIARKKYLISAARRGLVSAYLRYLPTLRMDLGHVSYNDEYAESYTNVPYSANEFTIALDQILYSPDLVTNIIVKHKKLKFNKAEETLTRANTEYQTGNLYIETLMMENMIKVQQEYLQEVRESLAIARVRQKTGKCGYEEVFRWAGEVSEAEKKLLSMQAEYKNSKITISKLLNANQKADFQFLPLTAKDPAFFTSDLNVIDHVRTPQKLGKFTDMLIEEVKYLSPETTKLKAAIAMKKAEIGNYAQKFILPNAKLSVEHSTVFGRSLPYESSGHNQMKITGAAYGAATGYVRTGGNPMGAIAGYNRGWNSAPYLDLDNNSTRIFVAAQWKPIEGGHKIAEIARCKAELNELNAYLEEVNTEIEMHVRTVVNKAIAKYFMIEKSYKAMFAEAENYQMVKAKYLTGELPIDQMIDAQELYIAAKLDALNSQYDFFKELIWVQRGLISVNWTKALPEAKKWIEDIPSVLPAEPDFQL